MARRVPFTAAEKQSPYIALDRHRDVVLWKLEGLSDEQLRRPLVPSGTTVLGLVKHLDILRELLDGTTGAHPDA